MYYESPIKSTIFFDVEQDNAQYRHCMKCAMKKVLPRINAMKHFHPNKKCTSNVGESGGNKNTDETPILYIHPRNVA